MLNRKLLLKILAVSLFSGNVIDDSAEALQSTLLGREDFDDVDWEAIVSELKQQEVLGITSEVLRQIFERNLKVNLAHGIEAERKKSIMRYTQMAVVQNELCERIRAQGITVAVIKGMASACYYPFPVLRKMGDIDLIVKPEEYAQAVRILKESGFIETSETNEYHTSAKRNDITVELHRSPASVHKDVHGEFIRDFILSGLNAVEIKTSGIDSFPMLPWQQNGMELIWHIRQHLYNGLGFRQIIDWMMFVDHCLDDGKYSGFEFALKKSGLDNMAAVVTKMCQKYLGLREEGITWCRNADDRLCDDVLNYIIEQGNFGKKKQDDKVAKVLSGYSDLGMLFGEMQRRGLSSWNGAKKHPVLRCFAWAYAIKETIKHRKGSADFFEEYVTGKKRKKMFGRLYTVGSKWNLRYLVSKIREGSFGRFFSHLYLGISALEYRLLQCVWSVGTEKSVSPEQRREVSEGVTIIFKSFQRQEMAKQLVKSIRKQFPEIKIVIADDSEKPLMIEDPNLEIVQLPFNSGLSRGLNAALKKVSTPYVMRMDDDELFTCRTKLVQQLHFLKNHEDIGLVGFGVRDSLRWNSLKKRYNTYAKQTMHNAGRATSVAPMTRIDEAHVVFAKVPNVFLARTELVKKVGYDNNVRMLDHNDFFFRASGVIVSVLAEDTIIYHRHNFFDKGYMMFRNDTARDLQIINRSRNIESSG